MSRLKLLWLRLLLAIAIWTVLIFVADVVRSL